MPPRNEPKRSALDPAGYRNSAQPAETRVLLRAAANRLQAAGIGTATLDAQLLLAAATGVSRERLIAGLVSPDPEALKRFVEMIARREAREPIAYILGHREFFSLDFEVTPDVLIPRPETETLVSAALGLLRRAGRVADIGVGSGAIAVALAANAPEAQIVAVDISPAAIALARRNAQRMDCVARIDFLEGNCFAPLERVGLHNSFDLIVSNPPYVEDSMLSRLEPEVRDYEPRIALAGGYGGLDLHRRIAADAARFLRPGGQVLVEVGAGQAEAVASMWRNGGCAGVEIITDMAAVPRVVRVWL